MIKKLLLIGVILWVSYGNSQTITNGDFGTNASGWGCSPDVGTQSSFGGPSGGNKVASVHQSAGLCQTVSGFTIGSIYEISFVCSRTTSTGAPNTQTAELSINGGALSAQTISRTGGAFSLTGESFTFLATSTSHTITFTGPGSPYGNQGLVFDVISLGYVGLPIELVYFEVFPNEKGFVQIDWQTATESNNDYFSIERSKNGIDWTEIGREKGAGNSSIVLSYSSVDQSPYIGVSYYRLKQTDFNGTLEYSPLKSVNIELYYPEIQLYPNPAQNEISVQGEELDKQEIKLFNFLGQDVTRSATLTKISPSEFQVNIELLSNGFYTIKTGATVKRFQKL